MQKPSKKLQDTWNKKLLKSGFVDAEENNGKDPFLKRWDTYYGLGRMDCDSGFTHNKTNNINTVRFVAKLEYYRLAEHYGNNHNFESVFCQLVWMNHSEGLSIREIVKVMQDNGFTAYKNQVNNIIRNHATRMLSEIDPKAGCDE